MNYLKVPLVISTTCLTTNEFWTAVMLYHSRPHLVNRKLLAASQVLFYEVGLPNLDESHISKLLTKHAILYEMRKLNGIKKENITVEFIENILGNYLKNLKLSESYDSILTGDSSGVFISVRILLARNKSCGECVEVVVLNKNSNRATFIAVSEFEKLTCAPPFPYEIELNDSFNLRINLDNFEDADTNSAQWLADHLFPKLLKWSKQEDTVSVKTLSCIAVDDYSIVYNKLKQSYADDLVTKWPTKTTTNPQKYVFEDLAIASYLICLWKQYEKSEVSFVDCGCGNGLLVFLLNQEGYKGYGIDIRKRPIWEIYPQDTELLVDTVTPDSTFPNSNWIIGNHTDELTPWIPVLALRNSLNYFVLPCCTYDFTGQKYIRKNTKVSQYADYMDYIEKISKKCGFETKIDKLRIPSTKKICLIGFATSASMETKKLLINEVDQYIELRSKNKFVARNNVEEVRNCTKLNKDFLQTIVSQIVLQLLSEPNYLQKSNGDEWNSGRSLEMSIVCQGLSQGDLKQLKNECGGIQTLLRNHRYLFNVEKGSVKLRLPYRFDDVGEKYRSKPCWYFRNHENGCLFTAEECAYLH